MKPRSDDRVERRRVRGEFILWPRGGAKDNGAQRENIFAQVFYILVLSSTAVSHGQNKPQFALML